MNKVKLNELFDIEYGNQLDLNKLTPHKNGVNFVSRSSKNLGVSSKVDRLSKIEPYKAGLITVTLGGTYLLSSFVQQEDFYTAQNVKVLTPKIELSEFQKFFYCYAIMSNRFRYTSHGREANKTLDEILVPSIENVPTWVKSLDIDCLSEDLKFTAQIVKNKPYKEYQYELIKLSDIFDIKYGNSLELNSMELNQGGVSFVSRTSKNNGIAAKVKLVKDISSFQSGNITVAVSGSVMEAFLQPKPFYTAYHVMILASKNLMTDQEKLYYCACLRANKYRYSYGRQANKTLANLMVPKYCPDYIYEKDYICNIVKETKKITF